MKPADKELWQRYTAGDSYRLLAQERGLNEDSVRGRIGRVRRELEARVAELEVRRVALEARVAELEAQSQPAPHKLGTPWQLSGDWIIAGDIHCNTVNSTFSRRPLQVAQAFLSKPLRFMIAGDFINGNAFSDYDPVMAEPSFDEELESARAFLAQYLQVFDEIYIIVGNHDLRVTKKTKGAISPENLMRMVSHDPRIKVSHWGHAVIGSERGEWRVTHGSDFSVNQLAVAHELANKYHQHIIGWHEHHVAIGQDRWKRYVTINGGGLFDQSAMAYTQIEDNKKPNMANGFVMLKGGYPYVFNDLWTDWDWWLNAQETRKTA